MFWNRTPKLQMTVGYMNWKDNHEKTELNGVTLSFVLPGKPCVLHMDFSHLLTQASYVIPHEFS